MRVRAILVWLTVTLGGCLATPDRPPCAPPRDLVELSSSADDFSPAMTPDRREIVFSSSREGFPYKLFHAERPGPTGMFGNIVPIPTVANSGDDIFDPYFLDNDTLLYIAGSGDTGGQPRTMHRDGSASRFGTPIGPVFSELGSMLRPTLSADLLTIIYAKNSDLWISQRSTVDDPFRPERKLAISTAAVDGSPMLSPDGETLLFDTQSVVPGFNRIMRARRSGDEFTNPTLVDVDSAMTDEDDESPFPHPDGQTLVFISNRPGGIGLHDLWISCE